MKAFKSAFFSSLFVFIFLFINNINASNDTFSIDVEHYKIELKNIDFSNKTIVGQTTITFKSKTNDLEEIHLHLKALNVDSVIFEKQVLNSTKSDDNINLSLSRKLQKDETGILTLYYSGTPAKDPYWGGFYFSNADGGYAYNMGVAFVDQPHNYGRVWFPCIDNFVDKATYDFYISTNADKSAICSGNLIDSTLENNTITWHYKLTQEVPTYLVSFAVGNYKFINWTYKGIKQNHEVILAATPEDTAKMRSSFRNLNSGMDIFETYYSPYYWDRIGFVLVPFSSGAMEHACNIAYPKNAADGSLNRETLWAHELSHHWWGNLVTCEDGENMWLNEGWAVFSEKLFLLKQYGTERMAQALMDDLDYVMQYAHIEDDTILPLYPVPYPNTYGRHVYDKGGLVVNTLRNYMGDSLFFYSIHQYLENNKFGHANTKDLENQLSQYSKIDLTDFFNDWIYAPGYPHFIIRNIETTKNGNDWESDISFKLKTRFNQQKYLNTPLVVSVFDENWKRHDFEFRSDLENNFTFNTDFAPQLFLLNLDVNIANAVSFDMKRVKSKGTVNFDAGKMNLQVNEIKDSALVFVEHHWVGPDHDVSYKNPVKFSDYRYWTFSGIFPDNFKADAMINYNGTEGNINGQNYLDHTLNIQNEDSLILMYRTNPASPWNEYDNYEVFKGNIYDSRGVIKIYEIKPGDYCLGLYDFTADIQKMEAPEGYNIFPNPAEETFRIVFNDYQHDFDSVSLYDFNGKLIDRKPAKNKMEIDFNTSQLKTGEYLLKIFGNQEFTEKIIIK
jgi:hypothetical protein